MKLTVTDVKALDLDRFELNNEYRERKAVNDEFDPASHAYYTHCGHRIHLEPTALDGKHAILDANATTRAAVLAIEAEVNAAIVEAGGRSAELGWTFSRFAGCGMCPCSPGFLVDGGHRGVEKQVFVSVTVTD
ncbi:hypothetical protein [Amycolatopsis sp. DSM 110486]|uniref:hypothetical protein n=1 Tax=Amycolatopsis sp. DSM 110486 TaxID=2865832 RepID=UPI001C6A2A12|nr:hypothetical protein [Amycolatopsis sp. DSM 110486]QYN17482.1 hypothetical protein K1T34_32370 [Amycolatopsis sp. DSM 110486]